MLRAIYNRIIPRFKTGVPDVLENNGTTMPIEYRKRHNARRYILRLNVAGDGGCVTIPRGGSLAEARSFAQRNATWLEDRLRRRRESAKTTDADKIFFRGEEVAISSLQAQFSLNVPASENTALQIERALWQLAWQELPPRVAELASQHGLTVRRVSVRNQRSRWGSCSARGVVSLNWRLVQTPEFVRDYIIVHELMHLREMNHSNRFWKHVREAFPRTDEAEHWLKSHSALLRKS